MQLVLWYIYFGGALLTQLNLVPSITDHQYFTVFMGVVLVNAFLSALFPPMKQRSRAAVMGVAFGLLIVLRAVYIPIWMWHTSTPILEFDEFVVSQLGFNEPANVVKFFINPRSIPYHFAGTTGVIGYFRVYGFSFDALVLLVRHLSDLIVEVVKILFPVFIVVGAVRRRIEFK